MFYIFFVGLHSSLFTKSLQSVLGRIIPVTRASQLNFKNLEFQNHQFQNLFSNARDENSKRLAAFSVLFRQRNITLDQPHDHRIVRVNPVRFILSPTDHVRHDRRLAVSSDQ